MNKPPNILIAVPQEVAGYYGNLTRGLRTSGYPAAFFALKPCIYSNPMQPPFLSGRLLAAIGRITFHPHIAKPLRACAYILVAPVYYPTKIYFFCKALCSYDVFIFGYGFSFFNNHHIDKKILKMAGKTIIAVFNGSDSRPPYINGKCARLSIQKIVGLSRQLKRKVATIDCYADHIVDHPLSGHFHTKPFIKFLSLGLPFTIDHPPHPIHNIAPIIVHAPSHPETKGTEIIRGVIAELRTSHAFEYLELINVPNEKVLDALSRCDFVINEIYSDTLMAGLDTEAAWFAKPSIIGGYELEKLKNTLAEEEIPPSLTITPSKEALKNAVIKLLEDKAYRLDLGQKAAHFVHTRWSTTKVAARYVQLLEGHAHAHWYCDPNLISFVKGCGIADERRKAQIAAIVSTYGKSALQLQDKPAVENLMIQD